MGIDGLWTYEEVKKCERVIKLSQLKKELSIDREAKIAIDSSIIIKANFSVVWSKIFGNVGDGEANLDNLNEKYIASEVKRMLKESNQKFMRNGIIPIWCMEGDKTDDKISSQQYAETYKKDIFELIQYYLKAKKASINDVESKKRMEKFSLVDQIIKQMEFDTDFIIYDPTKENFSSVYSKFYSLLERTHLRTKLMNKEIYEIFKELEFKSIRIPEISQAEKLCVILTQIGYCQAVYSTDSDNLVLGAKHLLIKKKGSKSQYDTEYSLYSYYSILKEFKITPEKFFLLSVLLGNDFCRGLKGAGPKRALDLVRDKNIDIYDLDRKNCGDLRPDICLKYLTVSQEERNLVKERIILGNY